MTRLNFQRARSKFPLFFWARAKGSSRPYLSRAVLRHPPYTLKPFSAQKHPREERMKKKRERERRCRREWKKKLEDAAENRFAGRQAGARVHAPAKKAGRIFSCGCRNACSAVLFSRKFRWDSDIFFNCFFWDCKNWLLLELRMRTEIIFKKISLEKMGGLENCWQKLYIYKWVLDFK